jgi:hypothetical protein
MDEQQAERIWREYNDLSNHLEKTAEQRTDRIVRAVQDAAKIQADALLRANQDLAAVLRDLNETLRRLR